LTIAEMEAVVSAWERDLRFAGDDPNAMARSLGFDYGDDAEVAGVKCRRFLARLDEIGAAMDQPSTAMEADADAFAAAVDRFTVAVGRRAPYAPGDPDSLYVEVEARRREVLAAKNRTDRLALLASRMRAAYEKIQATMRSWCAGSGEDEGQDGGE
jgi:hypothetical protein